MTAERDRLAALLMACEHGGVEDEADYYRAYADRLIAAGVGFAATAHKPYSWTCPECGTLVTSIVRPDIDVERLARALTRITLGDLPEKGLADEIAAAYREDAG